MSTARPMTIERPSCGPAGGGLILAPRRLGGGSIAVDRPGHVLPWGDRPPHLSEPVLASRTSQSGGGPRKPQALAQAVAILGSGAQLRHAAALAGLALEDAAAAADALARQGILRPGTPLQFVDDFAQAAFYRRIPPVLRSLRHGEAARLLAVEGADPDTVCGHLLVSEPTGSPEIVAQLRNASASALASGRVDLASRYLSRALRETTDCRVRRAVLHELGRAERVERRRAAIEHMGEALALADRAEDRVAIAADLSEALVFAGEYARATQVLEQAGVSSAGISMRLVPSPQGVSSEAWDEAWCLPMSQALTALNSADELERTDVVVHELLSISRQRGSVGALAIALTHRAVLRTRRGELVGADADLRTLIDLARSRAVSHLLPVALVGALDAALERPELEQAIGTVAAPPGDDHIGAAALTREVRGRLALRRGDLEGAREELEAAAATYEAPRRYGANASSWRSALALALAHHDHDRARRLASDELQDARLSGSPRAIGVALRTLALLEGGEQAIDYLGEAVERLEPSYARLEHARALVDLGAALRRANRRVACREPLRAGLELAHRCGATRLRERAQIELQATGARPRRVFTSGAGALTTAERRVADLAVQGMTNPDIAQTLFVTINTVEGHLRHAYQKLSIHSRSQLREALQS